MNPLGSISLEAKLIAGGVLLLALLGALLGFVHHEVILARAEDRAKATEQALAGERAARAESDRRVVAVQQEAVHADSEASAARSDADGLRRSRDQLQQRLAAERRRATIDPAAADASAPAASPGDLRDDMLSGALDALGQLGPYADQLRISLDACIGSYNALTP